VWLHYLPHWAVTADPGTKLAVFATGPAIRAPGANLLSEAVATARAGGGPQLVVASLLRLSGHGEHDDSRYIEETLRESRLGLDCLPLAGQRLRKEGWADDAALREMESAAQRQIDEAVATTLREPLPDPNEEDWCALATRRLCEGVHDE